MNNIIPYGKHYIDQDDINSVVDVLKNKNLTQGQAVLSFEKAVAKFVGQSMPLQCHLGQLDYIWLI